MMYGTGVVHFHQKNQAFHTRPANRITS